MLREHTEILEPQNEGIPVKPLSTAELAQKATNGVPAPSQMSSESSGRVPLFAGEELIEFRRHWQDVQGSFVDEPRTAVQNADELVALLMTRLAQVFAGERAKLEHEWDKGENISTEDLRVALQRYRSFFDRLLSV